ncbi:hypothetical protein G8O24_10205 [Bradyrhizobium sp. INPA01-394B]|uniref:Uncharacterized protein n=1 Tax=Bradyrhizobium campsiandrae TaxID=1729892 RepID=A0ABR7U1R2_9BRAD|nr:hypothetical protein [Bradyrhizobium campsiandrae]MBC9877711.1 hypothetical protein [Bradyrhizobium campsiandrae]MBC9977733.1 hypothetical protein [Bradyrhizobium campsiandrae]
MPKNTIPKSFDDDPIVLGMNREASWPKAAFSLVAKANPYLADAAIEPPLGTGD